MPRPAAIPILLALSLAGCAPEAALRPDAPPPDADRVRALLASGTEVRAIRALYDAALVHEGERTTFDAVLAARDSGALRIEILGVLGGPRLIVAAEGGRFAAYDAERGEFLRGAATPENLEEVLRAPVDPEVFVGVLLGRAAALRPAEEPLADREGPLQRVLLRDGGARALRVWAEPPPAPARPRRLALEDADGPALIADFERWTDEDGDAAPALPARLTIRFPSADAELTLALEEAERNPELPERLFRLRAPPGARERDLDAETPG